MDLASRITALEDIEAIKRVKYDYFFFCDNKQAEKVRECFIEGPVKIDYGRIGCFDNRDALIEIFAKLACVDHIVEMHHAQNPRIDLLSNDHAKGVFGLYYYMIDTNQQLITQLGGFYDDEFQKVNGEWKLSATTFNVTSTTVTDIAEGMANILFAGRTAPVEVDDPSKQLS